MIPNPSLQAAKALMGALGAHPASILEDDLRGVVVKFGPKALTLALASVQKNYDMLCDITAVDWSKYTGKQKQKRYSILYNLYSTNTNSRLHFEVDLADGQEIASATSAYASADWAEREVFDLFGIRFQGHPDLRRIFLPQEFEGHPLRKEFPRQGMNPQDFPQE